MEKEKLFDIIIKHIQEVLTFINSEYDEPIGMNTTFNELGFDSFDRVDLMMRLEHKFNLHLDEDESKFQEFISVEDVVKFMNTKLNLNV